MKIIKKLFFLTVMIYFTTSFITAQMLPAIEEKYNSQFEYFLNNSIDINTIVINLDKIITETEGMADFENLYLHSKALLLKGLILSELGEKDKSVVALESAQTSTELALEFKNDADCFRIMGEAGSAIMLQKGVSYIIAHGGKVEEFIDRAIELNDRNIRAQVLKAQSLINKPFIFGGSVKKGVILLSELNSQNRGSKADRFFILYNLSIGLQKQKKLDDAKGICREALILYPDNKNAGRLLEELNS